MPDARLIRTDGGRIRNYIGSEKPRNKNTPSMFGTGRTGQRLKPETVAMCIKLARQDREKAESEG